MSTQLEKAKEEKPARETPMWSPWMDMDQMRKEMAEMMAGMFRGNWMQMPSLRFPEFEQVAQKFQPTFNMHKEGNNLIVEAALPGIDKKDIHLEVTPDTLTLSGEFKREEKADKDKVYRSEVHYGSFHRSLRLPAEVDAKKVSAELKDGMLRVQMPLVHPEQHKQVKVAIR